MSEVTEKKKRVAKKQPSKAEMLAFLDKNEAELNGVLAELKVEVAKIPPELKRTSECIYEAIVNLGQDLKDMKEERANINSQ